MVRPEHWNEYVDVNIPGIEGEARTFEVAGNSMEPVLVAGDFVVCDRVEQAQDIKEGVVYVIVSKAGLWVKYCKVVDDQIQLISANVLEYMPFSIPGEEIQEIWRPKLRITKQLEASGSIEASESNLLTRVAKIEGFLSSKFPDESDL